MEDNVESFRAQASLNSMGSSSDEILTDIVTTILGHRDNCPLSYIDIGCGTGNLISLLKHQRDSWIFNGCDYSDFQGDKSFHFFQYDFNSNFGEPFTTYDIVSSSEVIEHLENPRHFLRNLAKITKENGLIILSTPNIESFGSILTFWLKGYHRAFGDKDYPAHITPLTEYDMRNIITEIDGLELQEIHYINNGRIPGSALKWKQLVPFFRGKRFSDNFRVTIRKVSHS